MDAICVLFVLSSPLRLSSVSVTFTFSASLNDAAPVFPIVLSVDLMRVKRVDCLWIPFVCFFVFTIQIEFSECCV